MKQSLASINVYYSSSGGQSLLRMKTSAYRPYFVTRHKKDVQPHISPTLLFRNRHHLPSTHHHHHHQILLLSLSPNQTAMSNVKVILSNAVQAPTRSQPQAAFQRPLLQQVPKCNPTQWGMDSQPPAMLHYVCQWTPTKWKQLQQLHAATNQIHEVLMI